jgi:pseudouridine kinase
VDIKGRPFDDLAPTTSNRGQVRISPGGAARNIAENLARLNVKTTLLTVVGSDQYARMIIEETAKSGVDTSFVRVAPGTPSGVYLAVLDQNGHLAVSIDEMLIERASMVVVDANLATNALGTVLALARRNGVPVCMTTVSVSLARKVRRYLKDFAIVIGNVDEAGVLCGRPLTDVGEATRGAHELVHAGVKLAVITLGPRGLVYATSESNGYIPAVQCEVVDATGAGDALTSAVIYGYVNDFPVDDSLRLGVSAATVTLCCRDTVCRDLTQETLYQQMVI